jgi:hypothetical protein
VQQTDLPLVKIDRPEAWSLHLISGEPEQLSGLDRKSKSVSGKDGLKLMKGTE